MRKTTNYLLTHTPLDSEDIVSKFGGDLQYVPYEELSTIDQLDQLLPRSLILYQLAKVGHFVCVFENDELGPHTVNFFDPLGYRPDALLSRPMDPQYRYQYHQDYTHLLELLSQSDQIISNEHRFQMKGTSTCGKWCTIRLMYSCLTNEEFWNVWKRIPNRDLVVARLYESL